MRRYERDSLLRDLGKEVKLLSKLLELVLCICIVSRCNWFTAAQTSGWTLTQIYLSIARLIANNFSDCAGSSRQVVSILRDQDDDLLVNKDDLVIEVLQSVFFYGTRLQLECA